jgi:hypothetical protein
MSACLVSPEGTFRDPAGRLYRDGGRILREVYARQAPSVLEWVRSPLAQRWMQQRRMAATEILSSAPAGPVLLEHEIVFFPAYPWEWAPGQWIDAASLTLDLCEEAMESGFILKDATPLNVLFSGSRALLVDVLSVERRNPRSPLWLAYGQFVRTFLLPLCAYTYCGWPLSATLQRRDGYEPADLAPFLPLLRSWRRPLRSLVTLPLLLERFSRLATRRQEVPEDVASFSLRHLLRSARALLHSLSGVTRNSRWSQYTEAASHYASADHDAKQVFVRNSLRRMRPARVLDVGANTGVYSRIAAACGAEVVAWDTDVQATDLNWKAARTAGLSVLPLVADFARPTPAAGWRNGESMGLIDRAKGQFDCVLMLGIMHHLLLADQIPLSAILEQLVELSTRWAIVEWIPQEDSQFDDLCRGRHELYTHLRVEYFLNALALKFVVRGRKLLGNGRSLFLLEKIS